MTTNLWSSSVTKALTELWKQTDGCSIRIAVFPTELKTVLVPDDILKDQSIETAKKYMMYQWVNILSLIRANKLTHRAYLQITVEIDQKDNIIIANILYNWHTHESILEYNNKSIKFIED